MIELPREICHPIAPPCICRYPIATRERESAFASALMPVLSLHGAFTSLYTILKTSKNIFFSFSERVCNGMALLCDSPAYTQQWQSSPGAEMWLVVTFQRLGQLCVFNSLFQ